MLDKVTQTSGFDNYPPDTKIDYHVGRGEAV